MADFFFWFFILLFVVTILAWPTWPYTQERWPYRRGGEYRYAASATAAALAVLILVLFWLGLLTIAWPWAPTVAPVVVD